MKVVSSYSKHNLQYVDVTHIPGARCAYVHFCHADTEARDRKTEAENSLSTLSPCPHVLDLCPKPTHTEPFLFTLLALKNMMKNPGMWEKASGLLKLLWVCLLFYSFVKCDCSSEFILFYVLKIELKRNKQLKGAFWQIYFMSVLL